MTAKKDKSLERYASDEYIQKSKDVQYDLQSFKDPLVVGAMIHRLVEERERTNKIVDDINAKLEKLDEILQMLKENKVELPVEVQAKLDEIPDLLPDVDMQIIEFVGSKGNVCAEDVQKKFHYKGKNAASARMNHLHRAGFLDKKQVGRKVYYMKKRGT